MDIPLSIAVDYLIYAIEQEKEQAAWEIWAPMYPYMIMKWIDFVKFEDFKNKLFQKQYKYTQKSLEEIETEMLAVAAKYKGR